MYELGIVDVEEIGVEDRLNHARKPCSLVDMAFGEVAVEPIWDVKRAIYPECEEVVGRDCFCFTSPLKHK